MPCAYQIGSDINSLYFEVNRLRKFIAGKHCFFGLCEVTCAIVICVLQWCAKIKKCGHPWSKGLLQCISKWTEANQTSKWEKKEKSRLTQKYSSASLHVRHV